MTLRWLDDVEDLARETLPASVLRYVAQGARDGVTTGEAVAAWRGLRLLPHVLRDVTSPATATSLLGTDIATPVAVAPTTLQRAAHPDGEVAMAAGVAESGSLMVVSSNSGRSFADIAGTGVAWWLQAYVPQERTLAGPMLEAAVTAGARAVVLTVDTPVVGTRYDDGPSAWEDVETGWVRTNLGTAADAPKATDLGPGDIGWLREMTGLPVVVKGVLRADDARRCVEAGAEAVWVSNHGGRQLDRVASTVFCLPAVAAAVRTDAEVYVDGGVRCGLDLLLASALGARAAFVGRLPLFALAADGASGVERMFRDLGSELVEAMRLSGTPDLAQTREILAPRPAPIS
ncbi:MAG: alpha-hydroxy acid oxidase [Mycobacteriales bacterium]